MFSKPSVYHEQSKSQKTHKNQREAISRTSYYVTFLPYSNITYIEYCSDDRFALRQLCEMTIISVDRRIVPLLQTSATPTPIHYTRTTVNCRHVFHKHRHVSGKYLREVFFAALILSVHRVLNGGLQIMQMD